jgi:hypothetical protein
MQKASGLFLSIFGSLGEDSFKDWGVPIKDIKDMFTMSCCKNLDGAFKFLCFFDADRKPETSVSSFAVHKNTV